VLGGVMSSAIGAVSAKVDDWTDKLNDVAEGKGDASNIVDSVADSVAAGGGPMEQAGVRGVQASLQGKSPLWAAMKGAWAGASTGLKVAFVAAAVGLILLLLLSPVLLLILLVTVLIVVAVEKARSANN